MAGRDHSSTPLAQLRIAELDPLDRIARHFRLYELTVSETADRQRIDNRIPNDTVLRSAVNLARQVLDPIREAFGGFSPNSVFRAQALERSLKGKPSSWISTSQHTEGRACDVEIVAKPTLEIAAWASSTLPEFDQIICECCDPRQGPNSGWVHISLLPPGAGRNRRQVLSYVVEPVSGRLVYVSGLQASLA
ncbi:D-Ala-D-Ala carboxypeptidase family metallohydrolase [uncultured Piscinibacter sp.]|uniref:D-Ala-D-Ala carboxypeptidase family metallohydrolase n=1 Tax=uncultured Piscinibacter sp. TaxID=1131835 RepID=UPI002615F679|nr:D-Ala-D-Ala carboxypeptidase family metallohydrolase [uncultured Piscinibacter sp.]